MEPAPFGRGPRGRAEGVRAARPGPDGGGSGRPGSGPRCGGAGERPIGKALISSHMTRKRYYTHTCVIARGARPRRPRGARRSPASGAAPSVHVRRAWPSRSPERAGGSVWGAGGEGLRAEAAAGAPGGAPGARRGGRPRGGKRAAPSSGAPKPKARRARAAAELPAQPLGTCLVTLHDTSRRPPPRPESCQRGRPARRGAASRRGGGPRGPPRGREKKTNSPNSPRPRPRRRPRSRRRCGRGRAGASAAPRPPGAPAAAAAAGTPGLYS